jgi:hypothetical protein
MTKLWKKLEEIQCLKTTQIITGEIEIDDGVKLEFYLFKLETDLYEIHTRGKVIQIQDVTLLDWLYWAYFEDDDICIENEDLVIDTEVLAVETIF